MSGSPRHAAAGFTLIEVMVALVVVALGIGALLTTLASSADIVGRLRDKSFAQWIALNQIAQLHLSGNQPAVGVTRGSLDYANRHWGWEEEITDPGVAGILRVDVRVEPLAAGVDEPAQSTDDKPMAAIATAYGFLSSSVMRSSGLSPDWSLASAIQRGAGGGGLPPPVPQAAPQ